MQHTLLLQQDQISFQIVLSCGRTNGDLQQHQMELCTAETVSGERDQQNPFHTGGLLDRTSTDDRIIWQKRMKYKRRNQMTTLCGESDETPMGFNLSLQQKLFGGESISKDGDEKRNETNQWPPWPLQPLSSLG
jgi:hypothetical protein